MKVHDILNEGYYDPARDDKGKLDGSRKPKLTLRHLNRLRKMHERKAAERARRREVVQQLYGAMGEDDHGF